MICLFSLVLFVGCTTEGDKTNELTGKYEVEIYDGKVISGKEAMKSFYEKTKNKEALSIKITSKYVYNDEKKENIINVTYDGNKYIYKNGDINKEYLYLNYSTIGEYPTTSNFVRSESYCLANDVNITSEIIRHGWLSSSLIDPLDGTIIYTEYEYKDLCFKNTTILSIHQNYRSYGVNVFNKSTALELVDGLNWVKIEDLPNDPRFKFEWKTSNLHIDMTRKVVNDKNNMIILKDSNGYCNLSYMFDFENKVAMMHYPVISSMTGTLYALLSDEDIKKTEDLFSIFQGESGTNYGQYIAYNEANTVEFEINSDGSGKIFIKDLNIEEPLTNFFVHGDGYIYLYTNSQRNVYVFTMRGENKHGYTYVESMSKPSETLKRYFSDGMFFKWMGYPLK